MTRVYNVYTHYDVSPIRVRANSPQAALAIGCAVMAERKPQFKSLLSELPGTEGGAIYTDCRPLEAPSAVRSSDQHSAAIN